MIIHARKRNALTKIWMRDHNLYSKDLSTCTTIRITCRGHKWPIFRANPIIFTRPILLFIFSGTVFTRLVAPAYTAVRDEFRRRMGTATVSSLGGFDTCYSVPIVVPTITFMFQGMNVTLPQDNFLIHSSSGSLTCLAIASAPENVNSVLNVIANMQQQNHRLLFDVPNSRLGVARETCS